MLTTELRRYFPASPVLALDIETTGLSITGDSITAVSLSDGKDAAVVDVRQWVEDNQVLQPYHPLAAWLRDTVFDRRIIVHNGQFDLPMLHHNTGCGYPSDVWDTKLAEQLITAGQITTGNSLKAVANRRLGVTLSKDEDIRTGFGLDNVWTPEQIEYAETDSRVLVAIMREQEPHIAAQGLTAVCSLEMRCLPLFAEMERKGIRLDVPRLRELLALVAEETAEHEAALHRLLTPHIAWERMRIADSERDALAAWKANLEAIDAAYGREWDANRDSREWWLHEGTWAVGRELDGGKTITVEEVESWREGADSLIPMPTAKGRKRYIKRMVYLWRRQPGNERPAVHVPTLDEPINLKSQDQMSAAVASYLKAKGTRYPPPADWKAQTFSMWLADAPEAIAEELQPLKAYKKGAKLLDAFGDKLLSKTDSDGTLHGRYQQIGTATGRPTCSDPNLLQVPSDAKFRRCFIPRDGKLFIVADFSQIELRIMAQFSHDTAMQAAFSDGLDLHTYSAAGIFGVPFDAVSDKQRKVAKVCNFAILYGVGPMTMRRQIAAGGQQVTMKDAKDAIAGWRKTYPQAAALIQQWGEDALQHGYTASAWGRRRNFSRIWSDSPQAREEAGIIRRAGANHPIQGTSADITKLAMVFIADRVSPLGGSVIGQVYDEIITEVPEENAAHAAVLVRDSMREAAGLFITDIPVQTDTTISPSWSEADGVKLSDFL